VVSRSLSLSNVWRALARAQARASAWLRASLRRWLLSPLVALTVLGMICIGAAGYRLIELTQAQFDDRVLTLSSDVAVRATTQWVAQLASSLTRLAQRPEMVAALRGNDQANATAELGEAASLLGVETAGIIDASDRKLDTMVSSPELGTPDGWSAELLQDAAVQASIGRLVSGKSAATELGLTGHPDTPALYAITPVIDNGQVQGLLLVGVSLDRLFQITAASGLNGLVFYNPDGRAIFTKFSPDPHRVTEFRPLTVAMLDGTPSRNSALASLSDGSYGYMVRPLGTEGRRLGYLAVFQSLAQARADAHIVQILLLVTLILIGAGMIWLSNRLAGRLVQPVLSLVHAARSLVEGGSVSYPAQRTVGELRLLADAFNQISAQIRRQTDTLTEQARQSNYLFEASAELGRTLDLDESLQTAAEALYGLGGLSYVVVLVGRSELGPYTCRAVRGMSSEMIMEMMGHEYSVPLWGVMARALVGRQPLVIDDIIAQNRPRPGEFDWDVGRGSMLLFPVCGASGPSGLIMAGAPEARAFSTGSLGDLVFALSRIASQSVQNAQLYQEAIRSQEQLVTIQVISKLVASATQIESVLNVVVREAGEILGDSQAWLLLRDTATGASQLYGQSGPGELEAWDAIHQDAVTWVTRADQPIFYDPGQPIAQSPILVHSGAAMCVPLDVNEDTLGALVVVSRHHRRTFVEDDMIVLRTLTNAAAIAVRTAQLTQRFQTDYLELAQAWALRTDLRVWGQPGHAQRVATNAVTLAEAAHLPAAIVPVLQIAAHLHDIALETAEEEMRADFQPQVRHAEEGAQWLANAGLDGRVVTLVRNHHRPRPDLLIADSDLSRAVGILALANCVDSWLTGVLNRAPLTPTEVRERLIADAGCNFAPALVTEYIKLWTAGRLQLP
jgi:transcriptional regulator with GAF, ATPase, and Fis domain